MKKKIKLMMFLMITFISFSATTYASSVSVKVSSTSITKGNSVTVTAVISADSGIYTTEGTLTCKGAGVSKSRDLSFEDLNTASTSKSFSFTVKPTSSGTITCSTTNVNIRELKEASRYALASASATITVKEPVYIPPKTYSSNNNLKSLEVEGYSISPVFEKDTKEYSLEVPNGTEKVKINASLEDTTAKVSGAGEISVSEGTNKIEIKVTAENGNEKIYVINITVKELDPIEVMIDNKKYTIIRKEGIIEAPSNYDKDNIKIGDDEVLCYKNAVTGNILVGLKDEKGNASYYLYDEKNKTYTKYLGYKIGGIYLNILEMPDDKLPSGYVKKTFEYNDDKLDGYVLKDSNSSFYLIYAENELTGKEGIYVYDKQENTVQRYNSDLVKVYEDKADRYFLYFLIALLVLAVSIVTFSIILLNKKKKHKSKFA
ncbi:MAG: cadherin-like beta sandwich domain-containing protein [Bacilli bacterium]